MEIFGKVSAGGRGAANVGDIGLYIHKDNTVNIVIRKKEICKLERVLIGFEDNKMFLLNGEGQAKSLKVSHEDGRTFCVRSKNPDIYIRLKDCIGEYEALWDKNYKEWYINLINKEEK